MRIKRYPLPMSTRLKVGNAVTEEDRMVEVCGRLYSRRTIISKSKVPPTEVDVDGSRQYHRKISPPVMKCSSYSTSREPRVNDLKILQIRWKMQEPSTELRF
ncbi:hypothetical protein NPIL_20931 [Nephila pilipes]|uniref:Uncharacterized protein n=1 Tax=Nephila pilipes TaxID=299642 RepID=A0A8X6QMT2_NEPPI|nr:hypothetical protein NPIL_20931 [Nephila pilipes]